MLDSYTAALTAFHKSERALQTGITLVDSRYLEARRGRKRAIEILLRAWRLYWDHVAKHKCRRPASPADLSDEENERIQDISNRVEQLNT